MQDMGPKGAPIPSRHYSVFAANSSNLSTAQGQHTGGERHLLNHSIQQIGGFTLAAITGEKGENKGLRRREKGPWSLSPLLRLRLCVHVMHFAERRRDSAPTHRSPRPTHPTEEGEGHPCMHFPLIHYPSPLSSPPSIPIFSPLSPSSLSCRLLREGDGEGTPHLHHQPAATVAGAEEEEKG